MAGLTQFDLVSARRIAEVVRRVEGEPPRAKPLVFGRVYEDIVRGGGTNTSGAVRLGTFTGSWPIDELKAVTLANSTATVLVRNVSVPLDMDSKSPNAGIQRSVLISRVDGTYHAVEIEQGGNCGSWKDYLVTLSVSGCRGAGASAIVRAVDTGTAAVPPDNSGTGPISSIEMVSGGSGYAQVGREEPAVGVSAVSTAISFTLAYEELEEDCGIPYWRISGVTAAGDTVNWTPQTLTVAPLNSATEEVPAILNLNTTGVVVASGGKYYRESTSLAPYTHALSVSVSESSPSSGSGTESLLPVVDIDPTSPTFGRVTSITIDNGGSGFVAWTLEGSIPFGNMDLANIAGFKAYEQQLLGHENSCLRWFSVTTCATATASP